MAKNTIFVVLLMAICTASEALFSDLCLHPDCQKLSKLRYAKRLEHDSTIDELSKMYPTTSEGEAIANKSFEDLVAMLQSRQLTSVDVLKAYMSRSLNATKKYNCVTDFVPKSMDWATKLDNTTKSAGPLHGLPVSIGEDVDLQGLFSTLGFTRLLAKESAAKNSVIVDTLMGLGAIPFAKTNVAQGVYSATGSDNPVYGETESPLNSDSDFNQVTIGGASGAACLVATGAAKVALATDYVGSARLSAHFAGLAAFMPTPARMSAVGVHGVRNGGLPATTAIMADKARTISKVYEALVAEGLQRKLDATLAPVQWNAGLRQSTKKLRIGYFTTFSIFPTFGDTEDVIMSAVKSFGRRGHEMVEMEYFIDSWPAATVFTELFMGDGGKHLLDMLRGDEVAENLKMFRFNARIPMWIKRILARGPIVPTMARTRMVIGAGLEIQDGHLTKVVEQRNAIKKEVLEVMDKNQVDLILGPAFPTPAPRLQLAPYMFLGQFYTGLWNMLEFPAGVVTYGVESGKKVEDFNDENDPMLRLAKTNFNSSIGMPIGVQLVARPYQDELVLKAMSQLESTKIEPRSV